MITVNEVLKLQKSPELVSVPPGGKFIRVLSKWNIISFKIRLLVVLKLQNSRELVSAFKFKLVLCGLSEMKHVLKLDYYKYFLNLNLKVKTH